MSDHTGVESEGQGAATARIGPRLIPPAAPRFTCKGCPALTTKWWHEVLENDESDSGTTALCSAAGKAITAYWRASDPPPAWCPGAPPAPYDEPSEISNLKVENKRLHTALEESEEKQKEMADALKPFAEAFRYHQSSTFGRKAPDNLRIWAPSNGWVHGEAVTLGDFRRANQILLTTTPTQETSHVES